MKSSKFVRLTDDALLEAVWDNNNLLTEDYLVLTDTRDGTNHFCQNDGNGTSTNNGFLTQVWPITSTRYVRLSDPTVDFESRATYGASKLEYQLFRLHLPYTFIFDERIGFSLEIVLADRLNNRIRFSNFMFIYAENTNFLKPGKTFYFGEKRWSQYVDILIPAPYIIAQQVQLNPEGKLVVTDDSINKNLTKSVGIAQNSPIEVNFRWITATEEIEITNTTTKRTQYIASDIIFNTSLVQVPEFADISVSMEEASDGDYIKVNLLRSNSIQSFAEWHTLQSNLGKDYAVQLDARIYEENVETALLPFYLAPESDFSQTIEFVPIIKNTNVTVVIELQAIFTNLVDGTSFIRRTGLNLLGAQTGKYGKVRSKIGVEGFRPIKIYNSRPASVGFPFDSNIDFIEDNSTEDWKNFYSNPDAFFNDDKVKQKPVNRTNIPINARVQTVKVPYPVLVDRFNIVAKTQSQEINRTVWYGLGLLELVVYPFDNVYVFEIARNVSSSAIELQDLASYKDIRISFKSPNRETSSKLFYATGQIDLANGKIAFQVQEKQVGDIRQLFNTGFKSFYIINVSDFGDATVLYSGTYILYDSAEYQARLKAQQQMLLGESVINEQDIDDTAASAQPDVIRPVVTGFAPASGKPQKC